MTLSDTTQPVFRALADPTRRAILQMLAEEPRSVGALVEEFNVTRTAVVKHLKILEEGNLVGTQQKGRERINHLNPAPLQQAVAWLTFFDRFWDDKLENLKKVVEETYDD